MACPTAVRSTRRCICSENSAGSANKRAREGIMYVMRCFFQRIFSGEVGMHDRQRTL